ncbi:hypothetical protein [Actinoplanes sp. DH11]|uniref:hypothetical protein n=1 Tax=Actinoplanes sp. DH11 TaxID=2857011 RepID=UPI001E4FF69F|nr:hypothetical protein [Actinoplanes sp. DH11]
MQTWTIDGRTATNRAGAAEHLGLSTATINMYASPAGQRRYGFPAPLPQAEGLPQLFALEELDAFAAARRPAPRPTPQLDASADELVGSAGFAELIGVKPDTFHRYLTDSWAAWGQEHDGYLPRPDNWPGRPASVTDQVTARLGLVATIWTTAAGEVINEAAVAMRLGRDLEEIHRYRAAEARPAQVPAPLPEHIDGQLVYDGAAVDRAADSGARVSRRGRRPAPALIRHGFEGASGSLVNQLGLAALLEIPAPAVARYAKGGTFGFPTPVDGLAEHGPWYAFGDVLVFAARWASEHPMWRRSTVVEWATGDRKRTGGRKAGRRPTVGDLRAVLDEAGGDELTVAEIAARLSDRLNTDVSSQVVRRLKQALAAAPG